MATREDRRIKRQRVRKFHSSVEELKRHHKRLFQPDTGVWVVTLRPLFGTAGFSLVEGCLRCPAGDPGLKDKVLRCFMELKQTYGVRYGKKIVVSRALQKCTGRRLCTALCLFG